VIEIKKQKSVLARLLANENISVQQANFQTAFFDVESRTLGLPLWKQMSADMYDLLVGHEVGHALYSPASAEALKIKGVPFSYMNVIEDIRIEKAILAKYPGLVANFKRGYLEMMEMDIFSTKGRDINKMFFMDRLNLKAKGRDAIEVEFSAEEMPYVKMAMAVETFEDVGNVGRAIVAWLGAKNDSSDTPEDGPEGTIEIASFDQDADTEDSGDQSSQDTSEGSEGQPAEGESEQGDAEEGDEGKGEPADGEGDAEDGDEGDADDTDEDGSGAGGAPGAQDSDSEPEDKEKTATGKQVALGTALSVMKYLPEVETEYAQRQNMSSLVEGSAKTFVQGMTRQAFELLKNPYEVILQNREEHIKVLEKHGGGEMLAKAASGYQDFMVQTKQVVNLMAKEFEMRKAAFRSARARASTKGSLDVNKLHAYKYDDQLFKQVTTLADDKNHGMMMLVDYSGSMSNVMPSVIRQTIALVLFCKRVNIPFEVYGFTTREYDNLINSAISKASSRYVRFNYDDLVLNQLFTNKMPKRDFDQALETFYLQSQSSRYMPKIERLNGTPLNAALLASEFLIKDFMKSNPVHKMNLITLTDGESNSASAVSGIDGYANRDMILEVNRKRINIKSTYYGNCDSTAEILKAIKGNNITATNFFICGRHDFRKEMQRTVTGEKARQEAKNEMSRDGVWVSNDVHGYDRRFMIVDSSDTMSGKNDDFEIATTATTTQIAKAFSKFSGSKRGNRVITQKFMEIVA
jgi:ACT domain-containing protein